MARPKAPLLSAELIADNALSLIDETGDIQMAQLAKRLNVAPSSLYSHVSGKSDVIVLARDRMLEQIEKPLDTDWKVSTESLLRGLAYLYRKHGNILPLIFATEFTDERSIAVYEPVFSALLRGGFNPDQLRPIITMIEFQAFGLALGLPSPLMNESVRENLPAYAASIDYWRNDHDEALDFAVAVLLGGIEGVKPN